MERISWAAGLGHNGTIFYKSVMPLVYADDVDLIGRSDREVAVALSKFAEKLFFAHMSKKFNILQKGIVIWDHF